MPPKDEARLDAAVLPTTPTAQEPGTKEVLLRRVGHREVGGDAPDQAAGRPARAPRELGELPPDPSPRTPAGPRGT